MAIRYRSALVNLGAGNRRAWRLLSAGRGWQAPPGNGQPDLRGGELLIDLLNSIVAEIRLEIPLVLAALVFALLGGQLGLDVENMGRHFQRTCQPFHAAPDISGPGLHARRGRRAKLDDAEGSEHACKRP